VFVTLERLINLDEGYKRAFAVSGRQLLLIVDQGQHLLFENRCPHQGAPLHDGTLANGMLRCRRHGIEFDVHSGRPRLAQCGALTRWPVVYEGDRLGIDL